MSALFEKPPSHFKDYSTSQLARDAQLNTIMDNLNDTECHADEYRQFECEIPSPHVHDMCEETNLPRTHCLLPCCSCAKQSRSEETSGRRWPYIPIPKRVRKHRRSDSEIMVRLTDSEFEGAPDGRTVLVKTAPDDEIDTLILPAAIDTFGSSPSTFFSTSRSRRPSLTGSLSYPALMAQEMQIRASAKKYFDELGNDGANMAEQKGKEALRRMLWGKEILEMFPVECVRDFG